MNKLIFSFVFLFHSFFAFSQIEKEIIQDGIFLSLLIENGDFDKIEGYLKNKSFIFDKEGSEENMLIYMKPDGSSNIGLFFDFSTDYVKLGFVLVGEKYNFSKIKIKTLLNSNEFFKSVSDDTFIFYISKTEKDSNQNELSDLFEYVSEIKLVNDKPIIEFYPPLYKEKKYDWEAIFLKLLKDIW